MLTRIALISTLLLFSLSSFAIETGPEQDSLNGSSTTSTKYFKHKVWKHNFSSWDDIGNLRVKQKVNWFQFENRKEWDANGNILIKEKNYPYGWERGKKKKWVYTYHPNGKMKSKAFIERKNLIVVDYQKETYDENGKLINKQEKFNHK